MNRENGLYCIELMKRATNLNMIDWQRMVGGITCKTVGDLHECGNTACFAGYVAISKKFQADGGTQSGGGRPKFNNQYGVDAIADWLDITCASASALCLGHNCGVPLGIGESDFSPVYGKIWKNVTPDDVIEQLQRLLDGQAL